MGVIDMYIITISNLKGGVSKSTMAINLARGLQLKDMNACIVDMDSQQSCYAWSKVRDDCNVKVFAANSKNLNEVLEGLSKYDIVLIDTPPQLNEIATMTIKLSNLVLIPTTASSFDFQATVSFAELVKARMDKVPELKSAIIMSKIKNKFGFSGEVRKALEQIGLPVLDTFIMDRIAYAKSCNEGLSVFELDDDKAQFDIKCLIKNIEELI